MQVGGKSTGEKANKKTSIKSEKFVEMTDKKLTIGDKCKKT